MTLEARTREALAWALDHTCLAIPQGWRTPAHWVWDEGDRSLSASSIDGDLKFHVAAERRRKLLTRIAVLSWEDDQGSATWEADMPNAGRFAEDGSYIPDPALAEMKEAPPHSLTER